jgi:hypothetical protein
MVKLWVTITSDLGHCGCRTTIRKRKSTFRVNDCLVMYVRNGLTITQCLVPDRTVPKECPLDSHRLSIIII